ncbi:hypothetical protein CGI02_18410 [Vibrio parahaemolyticus]|nr:hypothetical protein CGI02_18410 [Vibrio parahaemolyticus]
MDASLITSLISTIHRKVAFIAAFRRLGGGCAQIYVCLEIRVEYRFAAFKRKKREGYASRKLLHDDSRDQLIEL